jgi:hypothetical protein
MPPRLTRRSLSLTTRALVIPLRTEGMLPCDAPSARQLSAVALTEDVGRASASSAHPGPDAATTYAPFAFFDHAGLPLRLYSYIGGGHCC